LWFHTPAADQPSEATSCEASRLEWSLMMNGPSPGKSVTALCSGLEPRSTWSGSHGEASSCSPMQ
jgi:hypothetical protein